MNEKAIAIRSKEEIVRALFALMEKDEYEKISISEIAANANLDRRTLYRHFRTKEDIITYYLKTSAAEYETAFLKSHAHDNAAIAEAFFTAFYSRREELTLLLRHNLSFLLLTEISGYFAAFQNKFAPKEERTHPDRAYMLAYHIGGFWNVLNQWLSDECRKTPAEMAKIIQQVVETKQI